MVSIIYTVGSAYSSGPQRAGLGESLGAAVSLPASLVPGGPAQLLPTDHGLGPQEAGFTWHFLQRPLFKTGLTDQASR